MVGVSVLHLGAIVFVKDVEPMAGTVGETKTRRVIVLRKCSGSKDVFPCAVIKTVRGPNLGPYEIEIPSRPGGHPQTSLPVRSAAVCCWVINITADRVESLAGKCPSPITAEVMRSVQQFAKKVQPMPEIHGDSESDKAN